MRCFIHNYVLLCISNHVYVCIDLDFISMIFSGGKYERPQLKDLVEHVILLCAPEWQIIGILLDIPFGELRIIEADNKGVKKCVMEVLNKWLDSDHAASWEKILTAIKSPVVTCSDQSLTDRCE